MLLSKSNYLTGLQCPKLLWMKIHKKDSLPEFDVATQFRFSQGSEVGELAKNRYPDGIDISTEDFKDNLERTKKHLEERKVLFEAAFLVDKLYSRADVLIPVEEDEWDIVEVKSGTRVKEENLHDVAFQKHVYEKAGLKIRNSYLMHINNKYVRQGDLDLEALFTLEDITDDVVEFTKGLEERVEEMLSIMEAEDMPEVTVHVNCDNPHSCGVDCWDFLPEHNVFDLTRMGKKAFELMEDGVLHVKDIPEDYPLTSNQKLQIECALSGEVHVDKDKIKKFLKGLKKPLYYLDFETFNVAVPLFDGLRPYQQVPFQFSLHVVGDDVKHHSFLYKGSGDPRKEFLSELKSKLGSEGSIVVYNQSFEKGILKDLGEEFGEIDWVDGLNGRIVDLLVPFRNFWYYSSEQKGKAGLKSVLPALVGKDYSSLEISDGGTASVSYFNATYGVDVADREKVYADLEKYCSLDTEGMVWIVGKLEKVIE
jgi:hypothetical protein